MNPGLKRLPARFFRLDNGREPVREWLKSLGSEDRKTIGEDIKDVEFAREVRSSLTGGKIAWTWR